MKKIFVFLLILASLLLSSCDKIAALIPDKTEKKATFTAHHDYGFHQTNFATLLMDGSVIFFDKDEWKIQHLVAGDKINLTYIGDELLIQESYPSTIVTKDIEIVDISVEYADIIALEAYIDELTGRVALRAKDESLLVYKNNEFYVVDEYYGFSELDESFVGKNLFASGEYNDGHFTVHGIYDFERLIKV